MPPQIVWDDRFMTMAREVASWSKDPSRKVGAVIADSRHEVVALGYNGFPRSVADRADLLNDKRRKNAFTIHAEVNACLKLREYVGALTLYSTTFPCVHCAKVIEQAGVQRVVSPNNPLLDPGSKWAFSWDLALEIFQLGNVSVCYYNAGGNE